MPMPLTAVLRFLLAYALVLTVLPAIAATPVAEKTSERSSDEYFLIASPYSYHFSHNPDHDHVVLIGLERVRNNREVAGISLFSNSFGQPSTFIYPWGRLYSGLIRQAPQWYVKWAAGLLYGYKEPYEDKVPLNSNGFSPGLILAIGRPITPNTGVQFNLLGNSAVMLQFTVRLD